MRISVLGPLRVTIDGQNITPTAPKLRSLLAVMALRHDQMVTTTALTEELWGGAAPASSLATLQTYIYHLRKFLTEAGGHGKGTIITKPLGYILQLDEELDLDVFECLVEDGRKAQERGDHQEAQRLLNSALQIITGPPLSDVDGGPLLMAHITHLKESVLRALELQISSSIELGHYGELIRRLKSLIVEYPFHESFYATLMIVLQRSGRRPEALDVYQNLRNTLVSELGIEPSRELQGLQQKVLAGDTVPVLSPAPAKRRSFTRPAQLPRDIPDLVGREEQLGRVRSAIIRDDASTVGLVSITGMAGVGKTALAIRAAHSVRHLFADGQFYADMRGSESTPADPFDILGGCLRATELRDDQLPDNLVERSQLFRSWSAERRVLVVLDDVATSAQAAPLIPGGAGCCVLVTSRSPLPGLPGACTVELDTPDLDECVTLLKTVAGLCVTGDDLDAARTIVQLCGLLPLAIRAVGARLSAAPWYPVESLVARLTDERRRLRELRFGELDVSARLRPAYERLSADARSVLRILASGDMKVFTAASVASLLIADEFGVEALIELLVNERFLKPILSDSAGDQCFALTPLVSIFVQSEELAG